MALKTLGKLLAVFLIQGNLLYLLFNDPEVFSYASDKSKLIAKNFSKNSNLDDSDIFLPVFPSTTNLKLYNISKTPKIIKKSHNKP